MKILRIREGKMKLSLTKEEAISYGLIHGQVISNKDLCIVVRRILKGEKQPLSNEGIVVEAYPKVDGTCDIFVTEERGMSKKKEGGRARYYGFSTAEDLAFALYVCAKGKASPPLMEESETKMESTKENDMTREPPCKKETSLPCEVYDFFIAAEPKNENPECDLKFKRLPDLLIYRTESTRGENEEALYILEVMPQAAELDFLCEFGQELPTFSEELLREHTHPLSIKELLTLL